MDENTTSSNSANPSLASDEEHILREIVKLEELRDLDNPRPSPKFRPCLQNFLRVSDPLYHEIMENAREVTDFQRKVHKKRIKRHKTREGTLEELAQQKKKFIHKLPKDLDDHTLLYRYCYYFSRRISAFFKYFIRLNMFVNFIQIAPQAWALFFWYHSLYLHFALAFAIASLEYSTIWRIEKLIGEGSRELLGQSKQFEIVFCVGFFLTFVIGWTAARYRSKSLSVVYMLLLVLCTIFNLISANMEDSEKNTEILEKLLVERVRSFQQDPNKVPYLEQLQVQFACCGGRGPRDYLEGNAIYESGKVTKLPKSCCLRITSSLYQQRAVQCRVQQGVEWPLELNERGCGRNLAVYLNPTLALKFPLSLAFTYMCLLSLIACITFINLYRRLKDKTIAPTTKLTLGEKLLTALDIHRVSVIGDCSDATIDTLRKRLGRCETIPQIIFTIVQMINEIEDFLYLDPEFLARQILKVKHRRKTIQGQRDFDMECDANESADSLMEPEQVRLLGNAGQPSTISENHNQLERTRIHGKIKPESDRTRTVRLLAEVIRQSQNSVRNMKHQIQLIHPLAAANRPLEKELLPIAAKLLQTVTDIKNDEPQGPN